MKRRQDLKIALLIPSLEQGPYWGPLLKALSGEVKQLKLFTSQTWPGYSGDHPDSAYIEVVGRKNYLKTVKNKHGYDRGFMLLSPGIVTALWKFKPTTVYCQAFSLWTLWAVLMKPFLSWKLVLLYDGSTVNVDFKDSIIRKIWRRQLSRCFDFFISNNHSGEFYLKNHLNIPAEHISRTAYLVTDKSIFLETEDDLEIRQPEENKIIFLSVGQIIPRKNTAILITACEQLKKEYNGLFELWVVGAGDGYEDFLRAVRQRDLADTIYCFGYVEYSRLSAFYKRARVFVFPTFEDVWGMVVGEAMMFGLPVICSSKAGASEMIQESQNGHVFDPTDAKKLQSLMEGFIQNPQKIKLMGEESLREIKKYSVDSAKEELLRVGCL